jgi:hypothetical protein
MTFENEFPDYHPETLPIIPAHWQDASWHNDACPKWTMPWDQEVEIFVDYEDPDYRESGPDMDRFTILRDGEVKLATDNWSEILAWEFFERFAGEFPPATMTETEIAQALAEKHAHA